MHRIKLKSSDRSLFSVDVKAAQQSLTIKTMIDDLNFAEEGKNEPILLPGVNGVILKKVLEWATHHKNDPPYVEDNDSEMRTDDISEWDQKFISKVDKDTLFEIMLSASYLGIKRLHDVACKAIANEINKEALEQVQKIVDNYNTAGAGKQTSNENHSGLE